MILPNTKIEDFLDDVGRNSACPKIEADDASITVVTLSCDHQAKRTVLGDVLADIIVDAAVLAKLNLKGGANLH